MAGFHPSSLESDEYLQQANDAILTIVQIETKEAVENIHEIAAVPGIDLLFVETFDLGNICLHNVDGGMHVNMQAAIAKVFKAAKFAGSRLGYSATTPKSRAFYADQGFHMINVATDMYVLPAGIINALRTSKVLAT